MSLFLSKRQGNFEYLRLFQIPLLWYHNLKSNPTVEIRDRSDVYAMEAHEILDPIEKQRLWQLAVKAFPPYDDCQRRTDRVIPVFLATPII